MSEPLPDLPDHCWPVDTSLCAEEWAATPPPVQARAQAMAVQALRMLTGYRVGGCPITIRPRAERPWGGTYRTSPVVASTYAPFIVEGRWYNSVCGGFTSCGCRSGRFVHLPRPIREVSEVRVDGQVLDPSEYVVRANGLLRVGDALWPLYQDLAKPPTEKDTMSVTYLNAEPVDGLGALAAGSLACELAKAMLGAECRLPAGTTTVVRQGITMEIAPGLFPGGATGIPEVDQYVQAWNPYHLTSPSLVISPDVGS